MSGTIDVRVMATLCLILDVCCRDSDTTLPLLGRLVNCSILEELGKSFLCLSLRDGGGQGGLWELISRR